jgi:hypothetical protein
MHRAWHGPLEHRLDLVLVHGDTDTGDHVDEVSHQAKGK